MNSTVRSRPRGSSAEKRGGKPVSASLGAIRRLAVVKQGLGRAHSRRASKDSILSLVRDLAYVQWDPVSIVAPSHILSIWARLGDFRLSELNELLWEDRKLVQHWIPFAAIVLTEDYPIYGSFMHRYPESLSDGWGRQRAQAREFLASHASLQRKILRSLRDGPRTVDQFEDHARTRRHEGGWGSASDVSLMLGYLLMKGQVMIAGHDGAQSVWGLVRTELPRWADKDVLSTMEAECSAAERAIRALGTATPREIELHYLRGCYLDLPGTLSRLFDRSLVRRVAVEEPAGQSEERYVHDRDVSLLESLDSDFSERNVSLLPPFDNMVYSRQRLGRLFGFDYVREQFLPKDKRRFGTYVLPILWGDRLIGRIDARLDKDTARLLIHAIYAEKGAPMDRAVAIAIAEKIAGLANFLGARDVVYTSRVPARWRTAFR